ncbi:MAG: hypothetical protein E6K80_13415 [Candidatus Eisenbacteria bacterium]|uniref:FlgD/Vpr Ig-like domain-containing protein n=1 Tax=Eiseniibacteriota bacterium TaxID=2212470 RepID=A0A538TZA7_UNCEI|nr:MAG: hypothetical protein E6K80_13415 [Candidatus Eisenbacteria bacterium]
MITLSSPRRFRVWLGPLAALAIALCGAPARALVLVEDAIGEGGTAESASARWEALAVSSARSHIGNEGGGLTVDLAAGDRASFSRAADLSPTPSTVLCTFNVAVSAIAQDRSSTQVFRMGWDFGTSNADEPDARTYVALGLQASEGEGFQLRDMVGGRVSAIFHGTQAVTWAANNSGRPLLYTAPDGRVESIGNDRMDVWVGREKVFDDILAVTPAGRITDLKWFWGHGSGTTRLDRFEIRTLEETSASGAAVAAAEPATLDPMPEPADGSIALDRPAPNPFSGAMRFAYAIPGHGTAVDIGVFDIAGRRARTLARGREDAGLYQVRWDGLGDDGKRVKQGVYFLRASIGATSRVSRVVYLSN